MPAKDETTTSSPNVLAPKKSGNPMLPVIAVVILVPALVWAVMEFAVLPKLGAGAQAEKGAPALKKSGDTKDKIIPFGTGADQAIVVNISGTNSTRYLRARMSLELVDGGYKERVEENMPALRDAAIKILSSQPLTALDSPGGRETARNALLAAFNAQLEGALVEQVYFTEFVVQ
jgi:flagellar FliL protein